MYFNGGRATDLLNQSKMSVFDVAIPINQSENRRYAKERLGRLIPEMRERLEETSRSVCNRVSMRQ
jgi:hypothetical protein